jgi:hypothetical protein
MAEQTTEDRVRSLKIQASTAREVAQRHAAARQVAELQRDELMGKLASEYGVSTLLEGQALLAQLRRELDENVAEAEAALEGVRHQ